VPAGIQNGVLSYCAINADVISETYEDTQRENGKFVDFNDPRRFEDVTARNAFEYLQTVYIARN